MSHLNPPTIVEIPARTEPLNPETLFSVEEGKLEASEEFKSLVLPAAEKSEPASAYKFKAYAISNATTPEQLAAELPKDHAFSATEFLRIVAYIAEWGRTDWGVPREGPLYDENTLFFVRGVDGKEYPCSIVWENTDDHHIAPTRTYWKVYIVDLDTFLLNSAHDMNYQVFAPIVE